MPMIQFLSLFAISGIPGLEGCDTGVVFVHELYMDYLEVEHRLGPDGYLICYEFEMTDRMQAVLDNLSGTEENFQTIVKTKLRVTCSNFNEISDFEIPKEITSGAVEFEKSVRK